MLGWRCCSSDVDSSVFHEGLCRKLGVMIIGRGCWAEPGAALLLIHTGDASADCVTAQALMLRGESELGEPWARLLVLGLALLYLGRQDAVEATLEARPATETPVLPGDARLSVL